MQVDMQILDCDYMMLNNKPLIRLFGKTAEGEAVCALTSKTLPYFYIDVKDGLEKAKSEIEKSLGAQAETVEKILPIGYQKPKNILKVVGKDPSAVPDMKEAARKYGTPYEADILFKYRYLVDNMLKGMTWVRVEGKPAFTKTVRCKAIEAETVEPAQAEQKANAPLRYLSLDIEAVSDSDDRIPEAEKDGIVIISLCFFPDYKNKRTLVLSAKPIKTGSNVIACADEKEMLKKFIEIVNGYDPDIVIGYNINNFDMPYIVKRLEILQIPRDFGRTEKSVFCRKLQNGHSCSMSGRVVVDPYEIIKKDPWVKFKRYDLSTIAKAMLGEGKMEMNGIREMRALWNGDREQVKKFIDYSRVDAELAMRLVIEKGMLDKFFEVAKISGLLLQDALGGQSQRHECKLLHEFRKRNMIMPCKPEGAEMKKFEEEREDSGLKGAIVLEPLAGLHKDSSILVLDFTSLYPSLIRTFNICPSTLLLDKNSTEDSFTTPQGVRFVKHEVREGVIPAILRELMEARAAAKKQMKAATADQKRLLNAKQLALKDMANSVHPETDIVVKNPEGKIFITEIGNFFDKLSESYKIKKLNDTIEVVELDKWETLSVDGDKSCFKPVYAISRHKNERKLIRIRTKMGEVKVTPDHSIIEMKGKAANRTREAKFEGLNEVRGSDVSKNTIIAQVKSFDIDENYNNKQLNLIEMLLSLPEEDINDIYLFVPKFLGLNKHNWLENRVKIFEYLKQKGRSNSVEICKNLGFERRVLRTIENLGIERTGLTTVGNCGTVPVYDIMEVHGNEVSGDAEKSYFSCDGEKYIGFYKAFLNAREAANFYEIPLSYLKNIDMPLQILNNSKLSVGGSSGKGRRKIKSIIAITNELAELFGWFVSEGSTYKKQAEKGNWYNATIVNFDKSVLKRLKKIIKDIFDYDASMSETSISMSLKVFYFLFKHLCGRGAYNKKIPDFIINNTKEIRNAFLDAYIKGDGNKNGRRLNTVSKSLAAQLNFLLKEQNCIQHNGRDSNIFRISKRKSVVGKKIISGDLFGQVPVEIEEIEPSEYVYDLSVKDTEKFVTAQGLVLHNSMYGYTGYMRARLYVMDVANSVTAYGRENIIKTKKLIEDNFKKTVVYGDSMTGDRFVTVMNSKGMIEIKNIEDMFEENKNKIEFVRGKEFINLEGYKALTMIPETKKTEWMPIKQIIRHRIGKKIFRVNQKNGESIVTEDHSIITENNGKLEETKPQDMAGREMVRVKNIPKLKQLEFIDLYEILSPYKPKTIYKKREKTSSIKEENGWLVFGWTNRKNPVKIKRIIKTDSDEFESLCRLVGAFIAEGSSSTAETTKSRDGASIASSDVKWLEQLKEDYLKIFKNAKVSIIKSTKEKRMLTYKNTRAQTKTIEYEDNTHKLQMMNRLSAVFFKMLCGQKSYGKKIPEFIYHVSEKNQKIVIDNMIKGDGSRIFMNMRLNYSEQYKKDNFRYETRSLHLISGLSFLLSLLGQNYTIRFRPAKKTYILTTSTKNNSNTPTKITEEKYEGYVYDLSVEGSHMFVDSCGQILLHNTDSIFVKTNITDLDEAEKEGIKISSFVTEGLPGILDLKFEKIYKTFLILTKKRYAGWKFEKESGGWKDKIEMKGIETVRRDWCSLTGETMLNVLHIILKEGDIQKAAKFVRGVIEDLSAGKIPLEKLTIIKGVTRALGSYKGVQPHVELAKKIGKRDPTKAVIVGERLGYVIVKGNQLVSKRAEDPDYVREKGLEIDPQYYIENQMLPPIERIFEVCGVQKSELIEGSHQKKLFELFGKKAAEVKSPEQTVLKGFDSVVCKKCDWSFRRVPLAGKCPKCGNGLFFQKDGSEGASVEFGIGK